MIVDSKDNDVSMKNANLTTDNSNESKSGKKNKDASHFYNRDNSNKGYKSNYRNNQNKLNHRNSHSSMTSDFSNNNNNGRFHNNSSRGGNKKSKQNYNNSGNNTNPTTNNKKSVKEIKDIQKKLNKKLSKENTTVPPSTNDNNIVMDENKVPLTLDNFDPTILKSNDDTDPFINTEPTNLTETEKTENEDVEMNTEESDFLNGFSSDKIENAGKIFIGGLTYETTDEKLREHFEQFGKITECTVMKDNSGCSRGFGFITYENPEVLDKVLEMNHILDGKTIDPKRAIPRDRQDKTEKIFVGGIHPDVTEAEFKAAFDSFGKVIDATLITAKDTGKSRCFGFITYEDGRGVEIAYANRHNIVLNGKKVEVKYAASKPKLVGNALNPMMIGINSMNMRIPMGIPMGMGVINMPPQPPRMPPMKFSKSSSSSPKGKQAQKYYQQNIRSGQVGPIRNQHNHAYPQDFQYSHYNLNMNMYTTYNYNPYNSTGYIGYDYDNYNMPPMPSYVNPQPYPPNGNTTYPPSYVNRNVSHYSQGHSYDSNGNNNRSNSGVNSSNYYRSGSHISSNDTNNSSFNSAIANDNNENINSNYNVYNGYNMNIYPQNNYASFNGPQISRMNSTSSSSSSTSGNMNHHHHHNGNNRNSNGSMNDDNDEINNPSIYMSVSPRNNHGYHPYSR
ncbi:hypothetical protein BCR36DRAFT_586921 [Piromyces finnis]|uniref:RRM domain-containing protein n=1 Tax=Piromyces finnis TaxID=1754191 RepID=A0A1Y1UYV7_9FUNG|nr:hypothetical protein BCR36DRAFT_586921 [Piromyces finnis]|eukprot:ORX42996.1 hypothetical protein BCR36DRAFT_586921 [Piromyces finnis]